MKSTRLIFSLLLASLITTPLAGAKDASQKAEIKIDPRHQRAVCNQVKNGWKTVNKIISTYIQNISRYQAYTTTDFLRGTYCITTDSFEEGYIERYAMYKDQNDVIHQSLDRLKPFLRVSYKKDGSLSGRGGELLTWIAQMYAKTGDVDYLEYGRVTAYKLEAGNAFEDLISGNNQTKQHKTNN